MKDDCALIVFAKAPVPGQAKTRLARAMGDAAAARLASRMLTETLTQAIQAGIGPVELCCTPDTTHPAFTRAAIDHDLSLTLQGEGDLGMRMHRALTRSLLTHQRAVLIGTDAPDLGAMQLRDAAAALHTHAAVLVPAADGGYVLVGLVRPMRALFENIAWGSPDVMVRTRARCRTMGIAAAELAAIHDVDEPEDLVHIPAAWIT